MDRRGHGHAAGGNRFPRLGERVPTTTGFFRHRAVNRPVRSCADLSGAAHSAWPPPATPSFLGRIFLMTEIGNSASTTACSVRIRLGDSRATPTRPASRQAPANQLSSTVLPLPRGPISATSCGGALPPSRSAMHCASTPCSFLRPVGYGCATDGCWPIAPLAVLLGRRASLDKDSFLC